MTFELAQSYALFVIWAIISVPTVFYISYQLKLNWNEEWLVRRRRLSILVLCNILFYLVLIEFPLYAIGRLNILSRLAYEIMFTISYITNFWLVSFILLRIYLLYYDHEYNRTLAKNKWKILIDPISLPKQESWWLANRKRRYGDEQWIIHNILLPSTILITCIYITVRWVVVIYFDILDNFYHPFYYAWDIGFFAVWMFTAIGIGAYFWKKYPKFADAWLIRKEITTLLCLELFAAMQQTLLGIIQQIVGVSLMQISVAINSIIICFGLYVMIIYPQTAQIRKLKALRKKITTCEELKISWKQLVTTKDGYRSFMNFLEKELSTENLLFITEYVQLKWKMLEKETLKKKINDELGLLYDLNFPSTLPLSAIAKEFMEKMNKVDIADWSKVNEILWDALNEIYDKYINENTADLEVNISSRKRYAITNAFENKSVEKSVENILPPMENCVIEISSLLNDSRSRFLGNVEFTELAVTLSKSRSNSKPKTNSVNERESQITDVPSRTDIML